MAITETDRPGTMQGEVRMLIDGELVEAASGKRFDNVNPATEEVLGQVADAGVEDMQRAIAAARRAFDETDWSTNHAFRKQCLLQLQAAIESEQEELRAELVAEVGCPIGLTYGAQLDAPLSDALKWPAEFIDQFEWERDLPDGHAFGMHADAEGREGGGGRRGRDRAVELPVRSVVAEDRPGARHRQHRHPQARARHAVERDAHRSSRRGEDRHPCRRVQRRVVVGPPRR